jgi:hypothetical protein
MASKVSFKKWLAIWASLGAGIPMVLVSCQSIFGGVFPIWTVPFFPTMILFAATDGHENDKKLFAEVLFLTILANTLLYLIVGSAVWLIRWLKKKITESHKD